MPFGNCFALFDHPAIKRNHKVYLCSPVGVFNVPFWVYWSCFITHHKWAQGHRRTITGITPCEVLTRRRSIVLELHRLICDVTSSSGNRIRGILYARFLSICRTYCEKIDKDVVVEVISMSSVIVISSIVPAARVVISS